jgi:hypothetical protein
MPISLLFMGNSMLYELFTLSSAPLEVEGVSAAAYDPFNVGATGARLAWIATGLFHDLTSARNAPHKRR